MKKFELTLLAFFVLGLVLKLMHLPGGETLLVIAGGLMALCYSALGWWLFSHEKVQEPPIMVSIFTGISIALIFLGFTFRLQYFPGGNYLTLTGLISLAIPILLWFVAERRKERRPYLNRMALRLIFFGLLGFGMYSMSGKQLVYLLEIQRPEMAELKVKCWYEDDEAACAELKLLEQVHSLDR